MSTQQYVSLTKTKTLISMSIVLSPTIQGEIVSSKDLVNNGAWIHPTPSTHTTLLTYAKRRHTHRKIRFPLLTQATPQQIKRLLPHETSVIYLTVQIFAHHDVVLAKVNPKRSYTLNSDESKTSLRDLPNNTDWQMIISQRRGVGRKTIEKAMAKTQPSAEVVIEATLVL